MSNIAAIALHDTKRAAIKERDKGGSDEEILRAAMIAARDCWVAPKGDDVLVAACGGFLEARPELQDRVVAELEALRNLAALMNGVPVDMERFEAPEDPIGIGGVYREVVNSDA